MGDHPPCQDLGQADEAELDARTSGPLKYDPSVAEKACSVCPTYEQQGQGDKVVGSSPTVPRLLHRDGMTTRGYLAAFTAKIQYNA